MTPPRAVVEAVDGRLMQALQDGRMEINAANRREVAAEIASAVLAAHYAGEVEGPWRVECDPFSGHNEYHVVRGGWRPATSCIHCGKKDVGARWDYEVACFYGENNPNAESEARRVAHALNYTDSARPRQEEG